MSWYGFYILIFMRFLGIDPVVYPPPATAYRPSSSPWEEEGNSLGPYVPPPPRSSPPLRDDHHRSTNDASKNMPPEKTRSNAFWKRLYVIRNFTMHILNFRQSCFNEIFITDSIFYPLNCH